VDLSPDQLAVLEAMTRPDPSPPTEWDNAGAAIRRRLKDFNQDRAVAVLQELNDLGLTNVPAREWHVSATAMAHLMRFITQRGWEVLKQADKA
jgi:hypothetical protein